MDHPLMPNDDVAFFNAKPLTTFSVGPLELTLLGHALGQVPACRIIAGREILRTKR
jgi:hypothetical protein